MPRTVNGTGHRDEQVTIAAWSMVTVDGVPARARLEDALVDRDEERLLWPSPT